MKVLAMHNTTEDDIFPWLQHANCLRDKLDQAKAPGSIALGYFAARDSTVIGVSGRLLYLHLSAAYAQHIGDETLFQERLSRFEQEFPTECAKVPKGPPPPVLHSPVKLSPSNPKNVGPAPSPPHGNPYSSCLTHRI